MDEYGLINSYHLHTAGDMSAKAQYVAYTSCSNMLTCDEVELKYNVSCIQKYIF